MNLVTVNSYRMAVAREAAGLTVRQVAVHFGVDVRPGEYFGQMPRADLERARDIYDVRAGWLEEHGPINNPKEPWCFFDMIGAVEVRVCTHRARIVLGSETHG